MALFSMFGYIFQGSGTRADESAVYSPRETSSVRAQRGKLSKSDIGSPSNFKHVAHVGFNAIPGQDVCCDELKSLFDLAGVKEEHLNDRKLSRKIFEAIEKEGGIEAVRRKTRRMTTVEKSSTRTRLRSLSSSSLTPSKRHSYTIKSSPQALILPDSSPSIYLPALSKISPALPTLPPLNNFHSKPPFPPMHPYVGELSQTLSPATNPRVRPRSKKLAPPPLPPPVPQCLVARTSMNDQIIPVAKTSSDTASNSPSDNTSVSASPPPPSVLVEIMTTPLQSSLPNSDPPIKFGDVPPTPPPLPPFAKNLSSETSFSPSPSSEYFQSTEPIPAAEPPCITLKEQSSSNKLKNTICNRTSSQWETMASNKDIQQKNSTLFLDQIKQGMQLKSVNQKVKTEPAGCSNIVTALMEVIQRRNKAIQSSEDEDDTFADEWED